MSEKSDIEDSKANVKLKTNIRPETIIEEEPLTKVTEHTKKLVEKVVYLQDRYEFPDEQILRNVTVSRYFEG